jgi:hypothetical protein
MSLVKPPNYSGNPHKVYKDWHWGCASKKVIPLKDKRFPKNLIEIGLLMELHLKDTNGKPGKKKLCVGDADMNNNHVCFDMDHAAQRIYIVLSASSKKDAAAFFDKSRPVFKLVDIAKDAGSRHGAMRDYPDVRVQPLGWLTNLVYFCEKKGDGPSGYIHKMGEEGGKPPVLCVSEDGNLWLAAGSYSCPEPGITQ